MTAALPQAQLLDFEYSEAMEFITAMTVTAKVKHVSGLFRELNYEPDEQFLQDVRNLDHRLSEFVRREMSEFFGEDLFVNLFEAVLDRVFFAHPRVHSALELCERVEQTPYSELLAPMIEGICQDGFEAFLEGDDWSRLQSDDAALQRKIAASSLPVERKERLLQLVQFPDEAKRRMVFMTRRFYECSFLPMAATVREYCEEGIRKYRQLFAGQTERSFRELAKVDPHFIDRRTNVHITYFSQIRMVYWRDHREGFADWLFIGIHNDKAALNKGNQELVERFLKTMADGRRLEIIALLSQREWFGNELAQKLDLTPAAITYHMNFLIELNLVKLSRKENRIYYELEGDRLLQYFELSKSTVMGGSASSPAFSPDSSPSSSGRR